MCALRSFAASRALFSRGVPPLSRAAPRGRFFGIAVGAPRETDGDDAVAFWVRDPFGASVASSSSGGASCGDTPRGDMY